MAVELDALDQRIVSELRRDGRLARSDIARRVGVSETTVRKRVQRLINDGVIRIAAAVNLSSLGYNLHVLLGINCYPKMVADVVQRLTDAPEVRRLLVVSGRYDLVATVCLHSHNDLFAFLTERVGKIPGVRDTATLHVLRVVRQDYFFTEEHPGVTADDGLLPAIDGITNS